MIAGVFGSSKLSPVEIALASSTQAIKTRVVSRTSGKKSVQVLPGLSEDELIISSGVKELGSLWAELSEAQHQCLVLVCSTKGELYEYGLRELPEEFSRIDDSNIEQLMVSCAHDLSLGVVPTKTRDVIDAVLSSNYRESIVHKLHSTFYRISDKVRRDELRQNTMYYLAGVTKVAPNLSELPILQSLLHSKLAVKLMKAVRFAVRNGKDPDLAAKKFNIDRFDIAYVLSKV